MSWKWNEKNKIYWCMSLQQIRMNMKNKNRDKTWWKENWNSTKGTFNELDTISKRVSCFSTRLESASRTWSRKERNFEERKKACSKKIRGFNIPKKKPFLLIEISQFRRWHPISKSYKQMLNGIVDGASFGGFTVFRVIFNFNSDFTWVHGSSQTTRIFF